MGFATRTPFDWQLRTRSLALGERTLVMAAVNLTPDSFSGDGLASAAYDEAVKFAIQRLDSGADILDLGAESTRPGALPVSADAEQERLLPVLEAVLQERPSAVISVDTYHASTARAAVPPAPKSSTTSPACCGTTPWAKQSPNSGPAWC